MTTTYEYVPPTVHDVSRSVARLAQDPSWARNVGGNIAYNLRWPTSRLLKFTKRDAELVMRSHGAGDDVMRHAYKVAQYVRSYAYEYGRGL